MVFIYVSLIYVVKLLKANTFVNQPSRSILVCIATIYHVQLRSNQ